MSWSCRRSTLAEIAPLRAEFETSAGCQIVRWMNLARGFAYAVALEDSGRLVGYGVIRTTDDEDTLIEFFAPATPDPVAAARAILDFTRAPIIEAQTNLPGMPLILEKLGSHPQPGPLLFATDEQTRLEIAGVTFRELHKRDDIFPHNLEPEGPWGLEWEGRIVATGGFFTHYNPPYADLYMEVAPPFRRRGFGSFLLQELQIVCTKQGLIPAARCDRDNVASANCLQKSGMKICGELRTARVRQS